MGPPPPAGASGAPAVEAGATTEDLATLERRAGWSMALVALSGALGMLQALHLLADIKGYDEGSAFVATLDIAEGLSFFAAAIVFLRWLHRAVVCTKALAPRGQALHVRPSDAVISFFLPIANLWRPYKKLRLLSEMLDPLELPEPVPEPEPAPVGQYRASGRRAPAAAASWPETAPLGSWWATWITMNMVGRTVFHGADAVSPTILVLDGLLTALAALPAVLVVRSISLRIREIARRRSVPLPPKPFYG